MYCHPMCLDGLRKNHAKYVIVFGILTEIWAWRLPKLKAEAQNISPSYTTHFVMRIESLSQRAQPRDIR